MSETTSMNSVMGTIIAFLGAVVLGIIPWSFNIKSRVDLQGQQIIDLKELINVQLNGISQRLDRIEKALNGALRH